MEVIGARATRFQPSQERPLGEVIQKGYTYFRDRDVLLAKVTPCFENGKSGIAENLVNGIGFGTTELIVLRPKGKNLSEIVYCYISDPAFLHEGKKHMTGTGGLQRVTKRFVESYEVRVPPADAQRQIVEQLREQEQTVVSCRNLILTYEAKISARIAELWSSRAGAPGGTQES
jgi:restriction endonuclease S subunit